MFASISPAFYDLQAFVGLVAGATVVIILICAFVSSLRARRENSSATVESKDKPDHGAQSEDAAVPQPHDDVPPVTVTDDDQPAGFDNEAATLVGAAARWWEANQHPLTLTVEAAAKLVVDGKGTATFSGVEFDFDGKEEFEFTAGSLVKFVGSVRVVFAGPGSVRIGKDGYVALKQGGAIRIADNTEVVLEDGVALEAGNLTSVSASFDIDEAVVQAVNCQSVFGREGVQILAARCGTVYATNGNVFAYRCEKVFASHDAIVYAVRCDDVSATERSRVCHHECGKVRKSDDAVLEKQNAEAE